MARVGGLESPGPVLETGSVATSLTLSFSKTNENPDLSRGLMLISTHALRPSRHDSPNDPLRGRSDHAAFEGTEHHVDFSSVVRDLWSVRQDSNLRALRS